MVSAAKRPKEMKAIQWRGTAAKYLRDVTSTTGVTSKLAARYPPRVPM